MFEGGNVLAMGEWGWERLSVVPLWVLACRMRLGSMASQNRLKGLCGRVLL